MSAADAHRIVIVGGGAGGLPLATKLGEISGAARADVGEAVGEQDDAVDALLFEVPPNLPRA